MRLRIRIGPRATSCVPKPGPNDAAVGFEELVGDLEDCEHQAALGTPGDMAAAGLAPDEFAGLAFDALCGAFLVDQRALEHIGLFDIDMLMVGQHRARRKAHQGGHQAGPAIKQERLGLAAGEAGLLPFHLLRAHEMGMRIGVLRRRHGVHGEAPCDDLLSDPSRFASSRQQSVFERSGNRFA